MRSQNKKRSDIDKLKDGGLRSWHVIFVLVLFVIMLWAVIFSYNNREGVVTDILYKAYDNDLILNGAFVEHVNIGGLTKEQAVRKVNENYVYPVTKCVITFTAGSGKYKKDYTVEELGLSYDVEGIVDKAYKLGRKSGKSDTMEAVQELGDRREFLTPDFNLDDGKIRSAINTMSDELEKMGIKADKEMMMETLHDSLEKMVVIPPEDSVYYIPEISE